MSQTTLSPAPTAEQVADRLMGAALGWIETMAVHVGTELGWYRALASDGPLTADGLAVLTASSPRYAREWLEQQAASGLLEVDDPTLPAPTRRYSLAAGATEVLTDGASEAFMAPLARMLAASAAQMPALIEAYRTGGGVSWDQLGDHARLAQADMNRPWLARVPEVLGGHAHLEAVLSRPGARVADVGTGAGWSAIALAQAYPDLEVDGFDVDAPSVELARRNAAEAGVGERVRFHQADAAGMTAHGPFDAAVAFECVHDMPDPVSVLAAMREATMAGGTVVIMDEAVAAEFAPEADALDRLMYGFSLFVCLPDGLSHPGSVGTGTVMRPGTLRAYAQDAGFADVSILEDGFGLWRFYELHR